MEKLVHIASCSRRVPLSLPALPADRPRARARLCTPKPRRAGSVLSEEREPFLLAFLRSVPRPVAETSMAHSELRLHKSPEGGVRGGSELCT